MNKRQTLLLPLLILIQLGTSGIRAQWIPAQGMDGAYTYNIGVQDSIVFISANGQGISVRNILSGPWEKKNPDNPHKLIRSGNNMIFGGLYHLLRSNDYGTSWDTLSIEDYNIQNLVCLNDSVLFLTPLWCNYMLISYNNGESWDSVQHNLPLFEEIFLSGNNNTLFGSLYPQNRLYVSHDLGLTWDSVSYQGLPVDFFCYDIFEYQSSYWMACNPSGVYRFLEGPGCWVQTNDTLAFSGFETFMDELLGFGSQGVFQLNGTMDDWIPQNNGLETNNILDICSRDTLLLCATKYGPYKSYSSIYWQPIYDGLYGNDIKHIAYLNQEVWVCSHQGLYQSLDEGETFVKKEFPGVSDIKKVRLTDSVYYGISDHDFFLSPDIGTTWISQTEGLPNDGSITDFSLGSEYMFLHMGDTTYRSLYVPVFWEPIPAQITNTMFIRMEAHGYTLLAFSLPDYRILVSYDNGTTMDSLFQCGGYPLIDYEQDRFLFLCDSLYYSLDEGHTWYASSPIIQNLNCQSLSISPNGYGICGYYYLDGYINPYVYISYDEGNQWINVTDNLHHCGSTYFSDIGLVGLRTLLGSNANGLWYRDDLLTGVPASEIKKENTLLIFPNPAQDQISVLLNLAEEQSGTIDIYTILGEKIYSNDQVLFSTGKQPFTLETRSFPNGLYLIVIHLDGKEYSGKFVKH